MAGLNRKMIFIVNIWLKNGRVAEFEDYERRAARLLEKYGGRIECAVRPENPTRDERIPFEIHFVSFPDEQSFADYQADAGRLNLAELRNALIARTEIIVGIEAGIYHRPEFSAEK